MGTFFVKQHWGTAWMRARNRPHTGQGRLPQSPLKNDAGRPQLDGGARKNLKKYADLVSAWAVTNTSLDVEKRRPDSRPGLEFAYPL